MEINMREVFKRNLWMISQCYRKSTKKKDLMACLFIIELVSLIGTLIIFLSNFFLPLFNDIIQYVINYDHHMEKSNSSSHFILNFNIIESLKQNFMLFLIIFLPFAFTYILRILKIKRRTLFLISFILQIMVDSTMFHQVRLLVLLSIVCLFSINIFVPIGSGQYYEILKYLCYYPESLENKKRNDKIGNSVFWIKIIIGAFLFIIVAKSLVHNASPLLLFLVYLSVIILIFINSVEEKGESLIWQIALYILFAIIILINNNLFTVNIIVIAVAMVSIFSSIDKVLSSIKKYIALVNKESLEFLIYEVNDNEKLLKEKIDILKNGNVEISEKTLLRQIVINYKLKLFDETCNLIQAYKDLNYKNQIKLIDSIECLIKISSDISIKEQEKMLKKVWESESSGIEYIPLSIKYACILFLSKKDYKRIIEILNDHWLYIDDEYKYILYYAFIQTGDNRAAKVVRKEIDNFPQLEEEIEKFMKENENV